MFRPHQDNSFRWLTLQPDRGSWQALSVLPRLHSRPYVSNDNPYSQSQFKTMKYCPQFPSRFGSAEDGRLFCCGFFDYYNFHHRQRIGLMTPADVQIEPNSSPPLPDPSRSSTGSSRTLRSRNAATAFCLRRPWINPPAGKNAPLHDAAQAPLAATVHTWRTPFFCCHATRSWSMLTSTRRPHESSHHNRGSLNAACECLKVVDMFRKPRRR